MTAVLVAYGSREGSTAGIATLIGITLREEGLDVDVQPAGEVRHVEAYDAVVLGGALYTGRWHRDARRFAGRHAKQLREKQVWLFSSGPADRSADEQDIPPVPGVANVAAALQVRQHRTFGGRLSADASSWLARKMAANHGGDFRNPELIAAWAHQIAAQLKRPEEGSDDAQPQARSRRDDP